MRKLYEHKECVGFAKRLRQFPNILFAKIPQEIWTPSIKQIMFQKAEGMTSGVPDYIIILRCRSGKRKIVFIEMKRKEGGKTSKKQSIWIEAILECGINARVCNGELEAINYILKIIEEG